KFVGRLCANKRWNRILVESAESLQLKLSDGTAFGIGSRVQIGDDQRTQFWVMIDVDRLPENGEEGLRQIKSWIPKCAIILAVEVLAGRQFVPTENVFSAASINYSRDPQRGDAQFFRRRCRFDVLHAMISCLNANPSENLCNFAKLETMQSHTRIYTQEDFAEAIMYWQRKGYMTLLARGGDTRIEQSLDDEMMQELSSYSWDEKTPASASEATRRKDNPSITEYDVFISHASEDKETVVLPLTDELTKRGLRVWVDYRELQLGDTLRQRIDDGLIRSRFGVVVISPRFFAKRWPQTELDGLVALEMSEGKKRILPVWHDVEYESVAKQSPTLAARLAVKWNDGLSRVANDIERAIRT
ncbi:MAG: toll/interleukin-1 receptor domain-containing protein, partial [Planctomycetota bacterium]